MSKKRRKIHVRRKSRTGGQKDDQPFSHFPLCRQSEKVFWNSGQSQAEAAECLGVSRQTFNNRINGQNQPDYASLVRIADYFRVSTDYLLGRTETISPDTSIAGCGKLTGLSDKSIEKLIALYQENWENWYTYLLNGII